MRTVAVSAVGGLIGYGIVRSLRMIDGISILGLDASPAAVGKEWCDTFEVSEPIPSPGYLDFLKSVVERRSVELYFPGIPLDVSRLVGEGNKLHSVPSAFVLNRPDLVCMSEDKWATHVRLCEAGIPVIPSRLDGDFDSLAADLGLPFLLKPRHGASSQGIRRINARRDFDYWVPEEQHDFLFQTIVGDDESEFTVGVFGFGDGGDAGWIALQRRLSFEGWTREARVVRAPGLDAAIEKLVRLFKPLGPTNFQFRREGDNYLLLEVNARFSSSCSIRTAFGYNEAEMCVRFYLDRCRPRAPEVRFGAAVRYIEDLIRDDRNPG